jgi:ATP-binding cassette, subfamily B (MDR/TAP), member 1
VNSLITTFFSVLVQSLTTLIAGIIIAFIYEWRTSLVAVGLLPVIIFSGIIQMSFTQGFGDKTDKAYKESSNLIAEAINHIRTVTSFGSEEIVYRKYSAQLVEPMNFGIKKGFVSGLMYGLTQIVMFFIFGLIFYLGIVFMVHNNLEIADVFTAIYAILFSGMTAGNNAHFLPDVAAAKAAAASIFVILDSKDEDQLQEETGSKKLTSPINGHIVLRNVGFKYASRDQAVFKDLSL